MGLGMSLRVSTLKTIALIILIVLSFVILNITMLIGCESTIDKNSSLALNFCSGKWYGVPLFIFFWPLFLGDYVDRTFFNSSKVVAIFFEIIYVFVISCFTYILLKGDA